MKKVLQLVLVLITITSMTVAETAAIAPQNPNQDPQYSQRHAVGYSGRAGEIPSGTELRTTLDTRLSTETSRVGDTFTATLAQPVQDGNGNTVIPAGARVQGEVTEVQKGKTLGTIRGDKAKLNMRFREIQLPNGSVVPITATLISVNNTNHSGSKTDNEGEVSGGTSGTKVAKDVGIGAGVGTIAGLIFGSALKGLAIGAIAGGGYVLATGGKNVDLPEQTGMLLRLDQSVAVSGGR